MNKFHAFVLAAAILAPASGQAAVSGKPDTRINANLVSLRQAELKAGKQAEDVNIRVAGYYTPTCWYEYVYGPYGGEYMLVCN